MVECNGYLFLSDFPQEGEEGLYGHSEGLQGY